MPMASTFGPGTHWSLQAMARSRISRPTTPMPSSHAWRRCRSRRPTCCSPWAFSPSHAHSDAASVKPATIDVTVNADRR